MMIPLINPRRPPRQWFDKMRKEISRAYAPGFPQSRISAIIGDIWYHKLSSGKKKEIMSRYKKPLIAPHGKAGHSINRKGPTMARKTHRRRVSGLRGISAIEPGLISPTFGRKARRSRKRKVSRSASGKHRPALYFKHGEWFRPRRSKLFPRPVRLNRGRRHRRHSAFKGFATSHRHVRHNPFRSHRHVRHNPFRSHHRGRRSFMRRNPFRAKDLISARYLTGVLVIGGGIAAGFMALPITARLMGLLKVDTVKFGNWFGLGNIVLGGTLAMFLKRRELKEVGLIIAGVGVYDLISRNAPMLGLPIVNVADWTGKLMPAASGTLDRTIGYKPSLPTVGTSYQPMAASYQPMGSSYEQMGDEGVMQVFSDVYQ